MKTLKLVLISLFVLFATITYADKTVLSDSEIREIMIQSSIDNYSGNCPCPYFSASNGSRCGKRSAWSRPGGYEPLCYATDISEEMLGDYKNNNPVIVKTMKTYKVTDRETGLVLKLTGESPPTEAELIEIFDKENTKRQEASAKQGRDLFATEDLPQPETIKPWEKYATSKAVQDTSAAQEAPDETRRQKLNRLEALKAADDAKVMLGLLAIAKVTGMCGAFHQMTIFQDTTKMVGGDEFATRFINTEIARLGTTIEALVQTCQTSIQRYNSIVDLLNEK